MPTVTWGRRCPTNSATHDHFTVIIGCVLFVALCVGAFLLLMAKLDADWRSEEGKPPHEPKPDSRKEEQRRTEAMMPTLQEHGWTGSLSGPKPRKRIPKVSKKRRGENAYYASKRREFLARFRWCAVSPRLFGEEAAPATEVHHRAGRIGKNFLDESTWLPVCRDGHNRIHANPLCRPPQWLAGLNHTPK